MFEENPEAEPASLSKNIPQTKNSNLKRQQQKFNILFDFHIKWQKKVKVNPFFDRC